MKKCTENNCNDKATHQVGKIVNAIRFPEDYRPVCKKHGRHYSINYGYHLVKDSSI